MRYRLTFLLPNTSSSLVTFEVNNPRQISIKHIVWLFEKEGYLLVKIEHQSIVMEMWGGGWEEIEGVTNVLE